VPSSPSVSHYLRQITRGPRLELTAEQAQVASAKDGDRKAVESLISSNLPFVVHVAKEFRDRGVPFEDLISEGCVGLLKAIPRYRPVRGTRFMTYASFWVRKELLAAVVDRPHTIHVPRYAREHGCETVRVLSLDAPKGDEGTPSLAVRLRHPDPLPAEAAIESEKTHHVRSHVVRLAPRDQAVIAWRYGLGGQPEQTLNEIADRLGLSRERVRQIEVSALARLRDLIEKRLRPKAKSDLPGSTPGPKFPVLWEGSRLPRRPVDSALPSSRPGSTELRPRSRTSTQSTRS
jgi:RNA polymerase sigma factor (sigma-70 family)